MKRTKETAFQYKNVLTLKAHLLNLKLPITVTTVVCLPCMAAICFPCQVFLQKSLLTVDSLSDGDKR